MICKSKHFKNFNVDNEIVTHKQIQTNDQHKQQITFQINSRIVILVDVPDHSHKFKQNKFKHH